MRRFEVNLNTVQSSSGPSESGMFSQLQDFVDSEVSLYYRRAGPRSAQSQWDRFVRRLHGVGWRPVAAFATLAMAALLLVVVIATGTYTADMVGKVHQFTLENHARSVAGLHEITLAEAVLNSRYLRWAVPPAECAGDGAAGARAEGVYQDAEEVMEESANADKGGRRSLQQGGLSFGGSLTRRTDELSSAEWGALLLPSRYARSELLEYLYARAISCPFQTQSCTVGAGVSHKPDVPLESFGSCAVVGNDYSLLGAGYAAAIDAHDTVLRLAGNSLHGYERYIGGKTDATYMAYDCQAQKDPNTVASGLEPARLWILEDRGRSPLQRESFDCAAGQAAYAKAAGKGKPDAKDAKEGGGKRRLLKKEMYKPKFPEEIEKQIEAAVPKDLLPGGKVYLDPDRVRRKEERKRKESEAAAKAKKAGGGSKGAPDAASKAPDIMSGGDKASLEAEWNGGWGGGASAKPMSCDSVYNASLMKEPLCKHDWNKGWLGRQVLLTAHSPPLLKPTLGGPTQHMRDYSSAVLRKILELSPGIESLDTIDGDDLNMSDELFLTLHLLYSGLCTSVDLYGLPAAPGATYFGARQRHGYGIRLEYALARVLEGNGTLCLHGGFGRNRI